MAYDKYVPFIKPGDTRDLAKQSQFMEGFDYNPEENYQMGGKEYMKLYDAQSRVFGFVDSSFLVLSNRALEFFPNKDKTATDPRLEKNAKPGAKPVPGGVSRKVRLANSVDFLKAEKPSDKTVVIPCFRRPEKSEVYKTGEYRLATLFFVYQEVPGYYLVGSEFSFKVNQQREIVKGWIPKDRCIEWDTRLALEWNWRNWDKRSMPAVLFSDGKDEFNQEESLQTVIKYIEKQGTLVGAVKQAKTHDAVVDLINKQGVYIYEPFTLQASKLQFRRMEPSEARMPLLKDLRLADYDPTIQRFNAYRVAATAGFKGTITEAERRSLESQLKEISDSLSRLDVILVIDATASMRENIVAAVAAVAQIAAELRTDRSVTIQFALAFYRDRTEDKEPDWFTLFDYVPIPSHSLESRAARTAFDGLVVALNEERKASQSSLNTTRKAFSDLLKVAADPFFKLLEQAHGVEARGGGATPRESVLGGLREALTMAEADQRMSLKLAIVIGDRGDNGDSNETRQSIANLLIGRKQVPVALSVINVAGDLGAALETEMGVIVDDLNQNFNKGLISSDPKYGRVARIMRAARPSDVSQTVVEQVAILKARALEAKREIQDAMAGNFGMAITTPTARSALEAYGIKVADLQKIQGAEVYRTSILPFEIDHVVFDGSVDQQRGVRTNILMRKTEVQNLRDALKIIVGEDIRGRQIQDGDSLRGLVAKAVEAMVGELGKGKSFSEAMNTVAGLPTRSPLLSGSTEDFLKLVNSEKLLKSELERLTEVRKRLDDMLIDRFSRLEWVDGKDVDGFPTRILKSIAESPFGSSKNRSFTFGDTESKTDSDLKYYWVDVELEYP
ncbi:MAG: hypothetical protein H7Z17_06395 [Fuerstia sp.]|nr:hypothetical protein [Fuerstiella sp.]